jgi:hypothetical protein
MLETPTKTKQQIINSQFERIFSFIDEYRSVLNPYESDVELNNDERVIAGNASTKIKEEAALLLDLHYDALNSTFAKKHGYGHELDSSSLSLYVDCEHKDLENGEVYNSKKLEIRNRLNDLEKSLLETSQFLRTPNG